MGEDIIQTATEKLGFGESETIDTLTSSLPSIIDKLTPDGELPSDGFGLDDIISIARKLF